jgi:hypothetical protein
MHISLDATEFQALTEDPDNGRDIFLAMFRFVIFLLIGELANIVFF